MKEGNKVYAGGELSTARVAFETNSRVRDDLQRLANTGLFGWTVDVVAERLICEKLRDLADQGWLER